tara:strand:- start:5855 stop:6355 length:501 start_codon:yes stop_codon:yes gene_type:complete
MLSLISRQVVTSSVSSVTLTGINTNDVHLLTYHNVSATTSANGNMRLTESGTPNSSSNYDEGYQTMRSSTGMGFHTPELSSYFLLDWNVTSTINGTNNSVFIFNAYDSNNFTFITNNQTGWGVSSNELMSFNGGGVYHNTTQVDGIYYYMSSGNIDNGTFSLYRIT